MIIGGGIDKRGIKEDSKLKLVFLVAFLEIADRLAKTNWEST